MYIFPTCRSGLAELCYPFSLFFFTFVVTFFPFIILSNDPFTILPGIVFTFISASTLPCFHSTKPRYLNYLTSSSSSPPVAAHSFDFFWVALESLPLYSHSFKKKSPFSYQHLPSFFFFIPFTICNFSLFSASNAESSTNKVVTSDRFF